MTISKMEFKVTEVTIALGSGSQEHDLVGDMLMEGYPRPVIEAILRCAKVVQKSIEDEDCLYRVNKMIQEELDKNG